MVCSVSSVLPSTVNDLISKATAACAKRGRTTARESIAAAAINRQVSSMRSLSFTKDAADLHGMNSERLRRPAVDQRPQRVAQGRGIQIAIDLSSDRAVRLK